MTANVLLATDSLPLGLNFVEILIHILNLCLLIVGVRFLLYKPIKKFMDQRAEKYAKREEETAKNQKEAEELKSKYEKILDNAKVDAERIGQEITSSAQSEADAIVKKAKKEAEDILVKADEDAKIYGEKKMEELSEDISDVAVNMAKAILKREVRTEDNDEAITKVIENWKTDKQ